MYLLANRSVCAAVQSQAVPLAWKRAEPGYEYMGTRAWHRGENPQNHFVKYEMNCKIEMFLFIPAGTVWF